MRINTNRNTSRQTTTEIEKKKKKEVEKMTNGDRQTERKTKTE